MKLFGNSKRKTKSTRNLSAPHSNANAADVSDEQDSRLSPFSRAVLLLLAALVIFVSSVIVCFALIDKSAEPLALKGGDATSALKYVVDADPPKQVDAPITLEAPTGVDDSNLLNILLIATDTTTHNADTLMLLSVDLNTAEVGLLSIPRDTFVSGNYSMPKISSVYAESGERGVMALREQVRAMFGFEPDYYFIINEDSLAVALKAAGGLRFTVSAEPSYSALPAGTYDLTAAQAMSLLLFDADYDTVGTEPAKVQRSMMQSLLDALIADQENVQDNAEALVAAGDTDLTVQDLMYFGYLLKDTSFSASFSRALPGVEITIGDYAFYQVDPEEALELINTSFNPLDEDLTIFDINFRQKTGDSTEGEFSAYGFGNNTDDDDDDDDDDDETTVSEEVPTDTVDETQSETEETVQYDETTQGEAMPVDPTE